MTFVVTINLLRGGVPLACDQARHRKVHRRQVDVQRLQLRSDGGDVERLQLWGNGGSGLLHHRRRHQTPTDVPKQRLKLTRRLHGADDGRVAEESCLGKTVLHCLSEGFGGL